MDFSNLDDKQKAQLSHILQDPLNFARAVLLNPETEEPFVENFAQSIIFANARRKMVNYICAHRRSGKCVAGNTKVLDAKTLRPTPIVYGGTFSSTIVFDFKLNKLVESPCEHCVSGRKECVKLKLYSGETLTASLDHLVFTKRYGWIRAGKLVCGDELLGPSKIDVFGTLNLELKTLSELVSQTISNTFFADTIFQLTEEALQTFIYELWKETGRLWNNERVITFRCFDRDYAEDLQHLLLRLGVLSRFDSDFIYIEDEIDRMNLLNIFGLDTPILDVHSPRRWDTVIGIEKLSSPIDVYDLSVEHPDHNFLANNLIVHNSFSSVINALHALITRNKCKIQLFAPGTNQIDAFFQVFDQFVEGNPFVKDLLAKNGNTRSPQRRTFQNGSSIWGHVVHGSTRDREKLRGLTADMVFVDEAQALGEEDWLIIQPIWVGDRTRLMKVKTFITGSITVPEGLFYDRVFKGESLDPSYESVTYLPITKNKDFTKEEILRIEKITDSAVWRTEYLLEVGGTEGMVFRPEEVQKCFVADYNYGIYNKINHLEYYIGVDWDYTKVGPNIVVAQYDPGNEMVKIVHREEVPPGHMTQTKAIQRVIALGEEWGASRIVCDHGYGGVQFEQIQDTCAQRNNGLADKIEQLSFSQKVDTFDQATGEPLEKRKPVKNFLVETLRRKMEHNQFIASMKDKTLKEQLLKWKEKTRTDDRVTYSRKDEHLIDCVLFILWGIWKNHEQFSYDKSKVRAIQFAMPKLHSVDSSDIDEMNFIRTDLSFGYYGAEEVQRSGF